MARLAVTERDRCEETPSQALRASSPEGRALDNNAPHPRTVRLPQNGQIKSLPLHKGAIVRTMRPLARERYGYRETNMKL